MMVVVKGYTIGSDLTICDRIEENRIELERRGGWVSREVGKYGK